MTRGGHPLVEQLRQEVAAYEARFGLPSERMFDSVDAFPFNRETDDGREWATAYEELCHLVALGVT